MPVATGIREQIEQRERTVLGPHAALCAESKGRVHAEPEHPYRTGFQRDRDRILHTKTFRRLKHKTQVFLAPRGDHYRTRLTHTLEVTQIARTVARALMLNEDLTEAIALGHDLGHTPFGHAGERVLAQVLPGGFVHADQSLRVVEVLESNPRKPWRGLNLSFEVRDGIVNHSRGKAILTKHVERCAATLEGDVVAISDAIAYINHDIDDAVRAGVLRLEDLPAAAIRCLGESSSDRIESMVSALIHGSQDGPLAMTPDVRAATLELRDHMYRKVYPDERIDRNIRRAHKIIREMFDFHMENPTPESQAGDPADSLERRTADYIAGMTDAYALEVYARLFLPDSGPERP